jgi:hypothetical protein
MNLGYRSGSDTVALLATGGLRMNWEVVNNRQFFWRDALHLSQMQV